MNPKNGLGNDADVEAVDRNSEAHTADLRPTEFSSYRRFSQEQIHDLCAALEIPFEPRVVEWRVTRTSKNGKLRGQMIPYADQRAYTDRLNQLFTPAGWTRRYQVHTSANFQRSKDQKTVAKVFVTCELSISGIGAHSATGEEWTDHENAGTSAEAQSFKRAASCFGLGRYLYYFDGVWIDLDEGGRPRTVPSLPLWATPEGWREGMRPDKPSPHTGGAEIIRSNASANNRTNNAGSDDLVWKIEAMAKPLGRRLYRGVLRARAGVWNPDQIQDPVLRRKVLEQMQSAERGLRRLQLALSKTEPAALAGILQSLQVRSLDRIDSLEALKQVVVALETALSAMR